MARPVVIGIAGGSGSGKTTVQRRLIEAYAPDISVLEHDAYYRDLSHLPFEERTKTNFDHPDALETELLVAQLDRLVSGESIFIPVYDFNNHVRKPETVQVDPKPVILVEGILILAERELREKMDIKIFVDTDADVRLMRRIERDLIERGRTIESILFQYRATVRPMHLEFVEPSKRTADLIIPHGGHNEVALDMLLARIESLVQAAAR